MADIRLYREIYRINQASSGQSYTLINPYVITASVLDITTSLIIESPTVVNESTGVYYVDLTPNLYTQGDTYELLWSLTYLVNTSIKVVKTRFQYSPNTVQSIIVTNVRADVDIEVEDSERFEIIVNESEEVQLDVLNTTEYEFDVHQDIDCELNNNNELIIEINNSN